MHLLPHSATVRDVSAALHCNMSSTPNGARMRDKGGGGASVSPARRRATVAAQVVSPALTAAADSASSSMANVCSRMLAVCPSRSRKAVHAVTFMPEQPWIMSACQEGRFSAWSANDFTFVRPFPGHEPDGVQFMRWNRSGTIFATGDVRGTIRWWDTSVTKQAEVRAAHKDDVVRSAE